MLKNKSSDRAYLLGLSLIISFFIGTHAFADPNTGLDKASAWFISEDCSRTLSSGGVGAVADGLRERLKNNPQDAPGWLLLEQVEEACGNLDRAIETYKEFILHFPTDNQVDNIQKDIVRLEKRLRYEPLELKNSLSQSQMYLVNMTSGGLRKWASERMPLKVYISPGEQSDPGPIKLRSLAREAFMDWSNHSGSKVSFTFIEQPGAADIVFLWTKDKQKITTPGRGGYTHCERKSDNLNKAYIYCLTIYQQTEQPITDSFARELSRHEIGHALGLPHSIDNADIMFPMIWRTERNISPGDQHMLIRLYTESENVLYKEVISLYEKVLGKESPALGTLHSTYGDMLYRTNQFTECTNIYSKALNCYRLAKQQSKEIDPNYKNILQRLNYCYGSLNKEVEAESTYKELLGCDQTGKTLDTANSLLNLGSLAYRNNKYEEAATYYRRACTIYKTEKNDSNYRDTLQNLASCYLQLKNDAEAEKAYKELLTLSEKHRGENTETANCLYRLGYLAYKNKKYEEALPYYRRACTIFKQEKYNDGNVRQCLADYKFLTDYFQHTGAKKLP